MLRPRPSLLAIALLAAVLVASSASVADAEGLESGSVLMRVVDPIAVQKLTDLGFGQLSVGAGGGAVVVGTNGARRTTGGVILEGGTVSAASFEVTGRRNVRYDIMLPSSITISNGSETMVVDRFRTNRRNDSGRLRRGRDVFRVGARLNVGAGQATGEYSGYVDVTVAYQ